MIHLFLFALCLVKLEANFAFALDEFLRSYTSEEKGSPWQIQADSLSYSEKEGLYVAEGSVVITRDGQRLSARTARYNEKTGVVEATGDLRFEANGDILTGEGGVFNLNTLQGQITKGHLFIRENHFYVSGTAMEMLGRNNYRIKDCRVTTCDGEKPAWSITGSEVEVTVEGYGTVRHAAFRIKDFPVFYLPYAVFPAKTKRQTGLLPPRLGYSSQNGADVEVPFFWAISDQTDATFYERFMSDRGFMQGLEFRYLAESDSKGFFLFDILSDRVDRKDLDDPDQVDLSPFPRTNRTRYWLRSRTDQQMPLGLQARLDTDFVSDQDYFKEFRGGLLGFEARPDLAEESGRPVEEIYSPTRRSALRLSRDGQGYSLQGLASFNQRPENPPDDDTPQPLGGWAFSMLPRPLPWFPLFLRFDTEYDYIWREVGQKGNRISFSSEASYPMWFGRYLEFEPSIRFTRNTQWLDDHRNIDHQSRDAYHLQARISTILERVFDFEWRNTKRLKHKFTPSLTYEFRSHKDQDRFRPWFEPIDVEGDVNVVTLSLDNLLDARKENDKGHVTYSQWGTFSLSQGFDIDEAKRDEEPGLEREPFEPLVGILTFMLLPNLDLDAEVRWDHDDDDISFTDLSLDLTIDRSGGRKDIYGIDYQNVEGEGETINYRVHVNLSYGFSVGTSLRRDLDVGDTVESSYWLDYQSQCWGVRLITETLDEVDTVMVAFRLLGVGGI
jgi:LPS-assembly protein